jgi:hypothetical protein
LRKTIEEHLYCFKRYTQGVEYDYVDASLGVPAFLSRVPYDGVILHYTLLGARRDRRYFRHFLRSAGNLKNVRAPKVAIPQDEYDNTSGLWQFFNACGVETVFTCAMERDYEKLYPVGKVGLKYRITTLPGYVDELALARIESGGYRQKDRLVDIGHRAGRLPYWFGRYGQRKYEIGGVVKDYCQRYTNLKVDISSRGQDLFLEGGLMKLLGWGDSWLKFLGRCKAVLGCESGTRLLDVDGSIRDCVESYMGEHPEASIDEVEGTCFAGKEGEINLLTVGPRHFEAAMTKTCQILLEGDYAGILKPGIHYIELKSDYSNLKEVIGKVQDDRNRNKVVEKAYEDLVLSGKYSYRVFANQVIDHLRKVGKPMRKNGREGLRGGIGRSKMLTRLLVWLWGKYSKGWLTFEDVYGWLVYRCLVIPGSWLKRILFGLPSGRGRRDDEKKG